MRRNDAYDTKSDYAANSQKRRFRGTVSATAGSRHLSIQPFSQNVFPIAFSRNGSSEMEKRDCCEKMSGWLRDAALIC